MPDILDDLRTELDSAFERAEREQRRPSSRSRALKLLLPVAAVALVIAYLPAREGIPADERAVPAGPRIVHIDPRTGKIVPPFERLAGLDRYGPVRATAYGRTANTVRIDRGRDEGVHRGDPVIGGAGLVGTVASATRGSSVVTLITDQRFATSAFAGRAQYAGSVTSAGASPGELLFEPVDANADVRANDLVSTAGTLDPALRSRYPRAVPIGRVSRIERGSGDLVRRIYVQPVADLTRLDTVQVLTDPHAGDG